MHFSKRIKFYLVGFIMGLCVVYIILINREGTGWMPNDRVLLRLNSTELVMDAAMQCRLGCHGVTDDDIYKNLLQNGDVKFEESQTQAEPKVYVVEAEKEGEENFKVTFEVSDSTSHIIGVERVGKVVECACD